MKRLLFISNLGILIVLNLIWTVNTVYFTDDFKLIFEQPTRGVIECLGAIVSIKDAYALDNEVMDYTGDYRTAYNIQQAYQQDQRNLPQAGLASTQLNTSPLSLSIGGQTYQVQRLMPGQSATGTSGSAVGVIYERGRGANLFGGHSAVRINDKVYEIEKLGLGNGVVRERNYSELLNDNRPGREIIVNFLTPQQINQLEANLKQTLGKKTLYLYLDNNCANFVKDQFGKIGVRFPDNLVDSPRATYNQTMQLNQNPRAACVNNGQQQQFQTTSYDLLRTVVNPSIGMGVPNMPFYLDMRTRFQNTNAFPNFPTVGPTGQDRMQYYAPPMRMPPPQINIPKSNFNR